MVGSIDEVDLRSMVLLKQLAELDELAPDDLEATKTLATSSLELVERLVELGGGSIGLERLQSIAAALQEALKN